VLITAVKTAQSEKKLKSDVSASDFKLAVFDKGILDALLSNNQTVRLLSPSYCGDSSSLCGPCLM
jgi:hypothetical protein